MSSKHSATFEVGANLRRVLPRPEIVVAAVLLLLLLEGTWLFADYLDPWGTGASTILAIRDSLVLAIAAGFAWHRVFAFHPLYNSEYRNWLSLTPWQKGKPLPLGPVYPVLGDLLVVGVLTLLLADPRLGSARFPRPSPLTAAIIFATAHASAVAMTAWLTEPRKPAYAAFFLIAVGLRLSTIWAPAFVVFLLAGWAVALHALSEGWKFFPWDETVNWGGRLKRQLKSSQHRGGVLSEESAPDRVPAEELGWPFAVLSPSTPTIMIAKQERLLIAGLASFATHGFLTVTSHIEMVQAMASMVLGYVVFFMALSRLAPAGGYHASPLNLAGRFFRLKWIIPGYDTIFVCSLAMLATAVGSAMIGHLLLGLSTPVLIPIVFFLTVVVWIYIGPDATAWELTAPCRLHHGRLNKQTYDQLT